MSRILVVVALALPACEYAPIEPASTGASGSSQRTVRDLTGAYRCTINEFPEFACTISKSAAGVISLEKRQGSVLFRGTIVADKRFGGFAFSGTTWCPIGACGGSLRGTIVQVGTKGELIGNFRQVVTASGPHKATTADLVVQLKPGLPTPRPQFGGASYGGATYGIRR